MNQYAPSQQAGAFVRPEVVATYDELWRCRYCRCPFVVPSLARDHERTCPSREA